MIRVAIIDDSPFVQKLLAAYLSRAGGVQVVGVAGNADAALELVDNTRPEVITLGVEMPEIKGTELLSLLHLASPESAVVMVSGVSRQAATITLQALEAGADDFHLKFTPEAPIEPEVWERELLAKVRAASQRRRAGRRNKQERELPLRVPAARSVVLPETKVPRPTVSGQQEAEKRLTTKVGDRSQRLILLGGSTGGITALERILAALPAASGDAILVVQHLPAAFTQSLMVQLQRRTHLPVVAASQGLPLSPDHVYLAPGGWQVRLLQTGRRLHFALEAGDPSTGYVPSIDVTFESASQITGIPLAAVLLSGMGADGVEGMAAIYAQGGDTLAQDSSSSVIFGMPQRAIERRVVQFIGTPEQIARRISRTKTAQVALEESVS